MRSKHAIFFLDLVLKHLACLFVLRRTVGNDALLCNEDTVMNFQGQFGVFLTDLVSMLDNVVMDACDICSGLYVLFGDMFLPDSVRRSFDVRLIG